MIRKANTGTLPPRTKAKMGGGKMIIPQNIVTLIDRVHSTSCKNYIYKKINNLAVTENLVDANDVFTITRCLEVLEENKLYSLNLWAEQVNLLTDEIGQCAANSMKGLLEPHERAEYSNLNNQFERSLWLYANVAPLFHDAVNAKFDYENRSLSSCSSFYAPELGSLDKDENRITHFKEKIAMFLSVKLSDIAILVQRTWHSGSYVYEISIIYSHLPESIYEVENGTLERRDIRKSNNIYISYDPNTGISNVHAKTLSERKKIFEVFAGVFFKLSVPMCRASLINYSCQHLTEPKQLEIGLEEVKYAHVTQLGINMRGSHFDFEIDLNNSNDIHYAAADMFGPNFSFSNYHVSTAKISLCLKKNKIFPERIVHIALRNNKSCSISAAHTNDWWTCMRLMKLWGIFDNWISMEDNSATA